MSEPLFPGTTVAVVGAGTMGSGIAHVAARAGHPVVLFDAQPEALDRARKGIAKDLAFLVSKQRIDATEADAVLARITMASDLAATARSALVVEAIAEDPAAKRSLFAALEAIVADDCILATNTSSISITDIAAGLRLPGRVVGMHFFNPAPRMALVEIVDGLRTDPAVAETLIATCKVWGKTPVRARSTPGFIVNRVARPYYGESMRTLAEGATDPATLDAVLRDCGAFPMGACELMDLIGLDVNLMVSRSVFEALGGDRRYAPSIVQQELVRAGRHGRKTGHGFHRYGEGVAAPAPTVEPPQGRAPAMSAPTHLGLLEPLVKRIAASGASMKRLTGDDRFHLHLQAGTARVMLCDGRTATRRAAEEGDPDLVLIDLAADFARTPRVVLARADQCSDAAWRDAVATFQAAGIEVVRIDDIGGMIVTRTVSMLVNEAADVLTQGIATVVDVDTAMRLGTGWTVPPFDWADRLGARFVAGVLDHLRDHYGEERYRVAPALQRRRWSGGKFHG
jgi:3-hydroxybutyryl-CoA dehydrogenase